MRWWYFFVHSACRVIPSRRRRCSAWATTIVAVSFLLCCCSWKNGVLSLLNCCCSWNEKKWILYLLTAFYSFRKSAFDGVFFLKSHFIQKSFSMERRAFPCSSQAQGYKLSRRLSSQQEYVTVTARFPLLAIKANVLRVNGECNDLIVLSFGPSFGKCNELDQLDLLRSKSRFS